MTNEKTEEMVETYIIETDPSSGLDIRYIPLRVSKSEAYHYPKVIYHTLNDSNEN